MTKVATLKDPGILTAIALVMMQVALQASVSTQTLKFPRECMVQFLRFHSATSQRSLHILLISISVVGLAYDDLFVRNPMLTPSGTHSFTPYSKRITNYEMKNTVGTELQ